MKLFTRSIMMRLGLPLIGLVIVVMVLANCGFIAIIGATESYNPLPQDIPNEICLEFIEVYTDKTFKEVAPENDEYAEIARKKAKKYSKRIRRAMNEEFTKHDIKVLECKKHFTEDDEKAKEKAPKADTVLHMQVKVAYKQTGALSATVYFSFEITNADKRLFAVPAQVDVGFAGSRDERKKKLQQMGRDIAKKIAEKIKEENEPDDEEENEDKD